MKNSGNLSIALTVVFVMAVGPVTQASAQQAFTSIQAFGDSYADTGNALAIAKQQFGATSAAYLGFLARYPTGRLSGGTNFVDTVSGILNLPVADYAIGGATTGTANVTVASFPGFSQEIAGFVASGARIAPSDLVLLQIGGDDASAYQKVGTLAGVPAAAAVSASQALNGINTIIGAGARTIVYAAPNSSLEPSNAGPTMPIGSAFSAAYNFDVQSSLAVIARSGVRVEYIDEGLLVSQIQARPGLYGVANTGTCPLTCIGNPVLQTQYLYYVDGIHLTSTGFAIVGEYIVNRLEAPSTLPAQGSVGTITEQAFAQTLFSRMDMFGGGTASGFAPQRELADLPPHPILGPPQDRRLSVYLLSDGDVSNGERTTTGAGFNLTSVGGTAGAEYRLTDYALVGAAFNYENSTFKISSGNGKTNSDSYQFGLYGTVATTNSFAQGLVAGGVQGYRNTRPGVVDTISSAPTGGTFIAGGKVGRLFDTSGVRVGPIAGLLYGHAQVNAFSENGDPVLTLNVGQQVEDTLVASGGGQIRFPFTYHAVRIEPYLNLTVESNVIGDGRIIEYGATSAPLIVDTFAVPTLDSRRPFGRVAGGVAAPITPSLSLTAFATTTFDRPGGNDFSGNGGFKYSF